MRAGDLVRFKYTRGDHEGWKIGLLKEYHNWEKVATIIYKDSSCDTPRLSNLLFDLVVDASIWENKN